LRATVADSPTTNRAFACRFCFELGAPTFEFRDVLRGRERRLAARQQEVAAEARLDLHAVADVAEVCDFL
jgi:hypothetical protein